MCMRSYNMELFISLLEVLTQLSISEPVIVSIVSDKSDRKMENIPFNLPSKNSISLAKSLLMLSIKNNGLQEN